MTRADNTHHLLTAAQQRRTATRARAEAALTTLRSSSSPITVATVCTEGCVSRSWLYSQQDLMAAVRAEAGTPRLTKPLAVTPVERATTDSLRQRLSLALQRNRELTDEVARLRLLLATAHGDRRAQAVSSRATPRPLTPLPGSSQPVTADTSQL